MKQFTLPTLLCLLVVSLFSCSSDNDEATTDNPTAYQQKSGTTGNVIYKKLEKHNYPNPARIDEELARAKQSIAASSLAGLHIKEEDAFYAEYDGKHTLTFITDRANRKDNETENIVLESNPDGTYNKYHFKYFFTQRELGNLHQLPEQTVLANTQVTPLLAGNGGGLININCFKVTQNYEFQWQCEAGNPHGPGHPDCQVGNSEIVLQPTTLTYTYLGCDQGGGGNGGNGGDTGGGNTGGGGSSDGGGNTGGGTGSGGGNDGGTGDGQSGSNHSLVQGQTLITQPLVVANQSNQFFSGLNTQQQQWATANQETYDAIVDYLTNENWSNESKQFATDLLDFAMQNENSKEIAKQLMEFLDEEGYSTDSLEAAENILYLSETLQIDALSVWQNTDYYRGKMSEEELSIFDSMLPNRQMNYLVAAQKAVDKTEEFFPSTSDDPCSLYNGKGDAFRHALWNGLSSMLIGSQLTEQLTTAHENRPPSYQYSHKETAMDMYNNSQGRYVAPLSDLSNIVDNIYNWHQSGNLKYLSNLSSSNCKATYDSQLISTN